MKTIEQGDIYHLGEHILGCGSAADDAFVKKLLGDIKIRMVLTDPPYGVDYVDSKGDFLKSIGRPLSKNRTIKSDGLQSEETYAAFTKAWVEPILKSMTSYNSFYVFNGDLMACALREGLKEAGIYYSQMLVWVKNTVALGRKDYLPMHEVIVYGWYGRHKMERQKAKSVMFHPKPARSSLHPTMKPVGLLRKLIPNSTKINEWVYDPFGGSGSTLIACDHLKRNCAMLEIDPQYVATIIARWEKLTGRIAIKR